MAQIDIVGSYNDVHIGRNVNFSIVKNHSDHSIELGIKYHINKNVIDNQNEIHRKRFYAINFKEHLGLSIGYRYNFNLSNSSVKPFVFYDFQFTNSTVRIKGYSPYNILEDNTVIYTEYIDFLAPTIALEQNIGIGYTVPAYCNLYFIHKIGIGLSSFINVDDRVIDNGDGFWEFSHIISFGIGYQI